MADVRLVEVTRRFGTVVALDRLSLEVKEGEFVSLLGPSGCGKTTTLRIVSGLIEPTAGWVEIGGRPMARVPAHRRNLGMVFQQYALFPHMTVAKNVAFGLEMCDLPRREVAARVSEALELVELRGMDARYPRELSGGQQQRVGLARALAIKPAVLLLDEPFGALDRKLRIEMQRELRELQCKLGITTLFVTHDQEEALSLSDRIAVLDYGQLEQFSTPIEIYERPETPFVANFIGMANLLNGTCADTDGGRAYIVTVGGLRMAAPTGGFLIREGASVAVTLRPEKIELAPRIVQERANKDNAEDRNLAYGRISGFTYLGGSTHYDVRLEGGEVLRVVKQNSRTLAASLPLNLGDLVMVSWEVEATRVLPGSLIGSHP